MTQRVALVTGAAGGIGGAIAERLLTDGAVVAGIDLAPSRLSGVHDFVADLGETDQLGELVAGIERELGRIDVLVNCAAVMELGWAQTLSADLLRRSLAVNVEAPILLAGAASGGMVARGYGRIVNIGSIHGSRGHPRHLAYDVSKAALNQVTRTLAIEFGRAGILVNAVAPGFVRSGMAIVDGEDALESSSFADVYLKHGRLPLQRAALPSEIAALVAWLANENTYVTGQVIGVDGGASVTF